MSFILDALRKAEQHRQQQQTPTLRLADADRRDSTGATRLAWPAALLTLLLINGAALLWWWPTERDEPAPVGVAPAGVPADTPPGTLRVRPAAAVIDTDVDTDVNSDVDTGLDTNIETAATAATAATPPAFVDTIADGPVTPPLSLDIHVYSEQPRRRFVLINGSRYQEGDRLTEGPLLQTITADGALLLDGRRRQIELRVER